VHQPVEQPDLPVVLVQRRGDDRPQVVLVEGVDDAGDQIPEVRPFDHRQRHGDKARARAREPTRGRVGRESALLDDTEHRFARIRGDTRLLVEHARDRRDRDAGFPCDVADGRRARILRRRL
jgi:hypothetical protein